MSHVPFLRGQVWIARCWQVHELSGASVFKDRPVLIVAVHRDWRGRVRMINALRGTSGSEWFADRSVTAFGSRFCVVYIHNLVPARFREFLGVIDRETLASTDEMLRNSLGLPKAA